MHLSSAQRIVQKEKEKKKRKKKRKCDPAPPIHALFTQTHRSTQAALFLLAFHFIRFASHSPPLLQRSQLSERVTRTYFRLRQLNVAPSLLFSPSLTMSMLCERSVVCDSRLHRCHMAVPV